MKEGRTKYQILFYQRHLRVSLRYLSVGLSSWSQLHYQQNEAQPLALAESNGNWQLEQKMTLSQPETH